MQSENEVHSQIVTLPSIPASGRCTIKVEDYETFSEILNNQEEKKEVEREEFKTKNYTEEFCQSVMVTGGVGFVGSHIAEALLREGRKVVVYDMFNSETSRSQEKIENAEFLAKTAKEFASQGATVTIVNGDVRDTESITRTVQEHGITACIHAGGLVDDRRSVEFPEEYIDINIVGTTRLLDTLGKCGVKMVVQPSTRSVFGQVANDDIRLEETSPRRPVNPYGFTKVASDAVAHCYSHLHKMNITLIRISSAYGPRGRPDMIPRILIESICEGKPVRKFGDGTATRTWVYITDIVAAFMAALKNPQGGFEEFNTGTPNSTTLNDLIECAEKVVGKKAIIENCPVPPGDANFAGHQSFEKIKKNLGWEPKVHIAEGFRLTYLDYLSRKKTT